MQHELSTPLIEGCDAELHRRLLQLIRSVGAWMSYGLRQLLRVFITESTLADITRSLDGSLC